MADIGVSLVDLKGASKPLTKLIESVSRGVGAIYGPIGKVRDAKAEAKAMVILAEAKNLVDDISARACERVSFREVRRQHNIDSIVGRAVKELPESVSEQEVNEDWIVNFFELSQDVGDVEMQQIWAKLLAGEVAKPGTFKPRTLLAVKSLTPEEARMFTVLCSFSFELDDGGRVLPNLSYEYFSFLRRNGFSVDMDLHLKNIGLLSGSELYYGADYDGEDEDGDFSLVKVKYFSQEYFISPKENIDDEDGDVFLEGFPLTEIGSELAAIAGAEQNHEYISHLIECGDILPQDDSVS